MIFSTSTKCVAVQLGGDVRFCVWMKNVWVK
jgi:hypothetical protein